jgi:hypothetical protein
MPEVQPQRQPDLPPGFSSWEEERQVKYLISSAVKSTELANIVRDEFGLEPREQAYLNKHELAKIILQQRGDA